MLKCTTRHIHIFAGELVGTQMAPSEERLTLDVDPDNELMWNDGSLQKVFGKFDELVAAYKGRDLTEYNLRRIGSDLEHFIRALLRQGDIAYNLNGRAINYSMGFPQVPVEQVTDQFIPPAH
jgi:NAD(P)H-quinone oxidoreductase subunit M